MIADTALLLPVTVGVDCMPPVALAPDCVGAEDILLKAMAAALVVFVATVSSAGLIDTEAAMTAVLGAFAHYLMAYWASWVWVKAIEPPMCFHAMGVAENLAGKSV